MRDALVEWLVDPDGHAPLTLDAAERDAGGHILAGSLRSGTGPTFPVLRGIPRFVARNDEGQAQVERSFAFKWAQRHSYQSPSMLDEGRRWLVARYGFDSVDAMGAHMSAARGVLDAGCGGGYSASLWMPGGWRGAMWIGADISEAVDVARDRLGALANTEFVQADVMQLPFRDESFDIVFSEGVLHHTPSTAAAFAAVTRLVRPGGELMAYVYRRKSPVREFTDDHVRAAIAGLSPEEAWEALRPLTALGQALASVRAEIDLAEPVPLLGIPAGRHDVQRLMYWHFAKLFWNDALSFEENHHINFDWYHPAYAHRHTESELREWCEAARLTIVHLDVQDSGYTVRARR